MPVSFVMATILLYLAGTVCFLVYLLRRSEALSTVSLWLTAAGFTTHTLALFLRMWSGTGAPLASF